MVEHTGKYQPSRRVPLPGSGASPAQLFTGQTKFFWEGLLLPQALNPRRRGTDPEFPLRRVPCHSLRRFRREAVPDKTGATDRR